MKPWKGKFPTASVDEDINRQLLLLTHPADQMAGTSSIGKIAYAPYVRCSIVSSSSQIVSYYDEHRELVVAHREAWGQPWGHIQTGSIIGWDSHNYPSLATDSLGLVHLSGNMHASPLVYFQLHPQHDWLLVKVPVMVTEEHERQVTYPEFLNGPAGSLMFWFRDGTSGNAVQRFYLYDPGVNQWEEPLSNGVIDGRGLRSAYLDGNRAQVDSNGRYHMAWLWRDNPDAESCHTICYAWSDDAVTWHSADNVVLDVPITFNAGVVVGLPDVGSGVINNNLRLVVSEKGEPYLLAHCRDGLGQQQIVLWEHRDGTWVQSFLTDWDVEWNFNGPGSLQFELQLGEPHIADGIVSLPVRWRDAVALLQCSLITREVEVTPTTLPWPGVGGVQRKSGDFLYCESIRNDLRESEEILATWEAASANRDRRGVLGGRDYSVLRIAIRALQL